MTGDDMRGIGIKVISQISNHILFGKKDDGNPGFSVGKKEKEVEKTEC